MAKKEFDYFEAFIEMGEVSKEAAVCLKEILNNYSNKEENMTRMHEIEHRGDQLHHKLNDELNRSFITPIEREDILGLGDAIDDLTDCIEDIIVRLYIFNIDTLRSEAFELCDVTVEACDKSILALKELKNYKKSQNIAQYAIEVNNCEEKGDEIYHRAVRRLFTEATDNPVELIRWRELFAVMEKCLDACETLADLIRAVVMKNS